MLILQSFYSCTEDGSRKAPYSLAKDAQCSVEESDKERACDTLIMCIVTTLNQGLRNGGGIGDILRRPSSKVCYWLICTV